MVRSPRAGRWPSLCTMGVSSGSARCVTRVSVSDAFHSFDDTVIGDAAPINRTTVKSRPHWMASALRLLIGSTLQEISVRASAFDEPLTATAFTPRACSDRGSTRGGHSWSTAGVVFVGRDKRRVFLLEFDASKADFVSHEITRLKQEMCASTVVDLAAQRQPDTRLYLVLGDGSVVVVDARAQLKMSAHGAVQPSAAMRWSASPACLGVEEDQGLSLCKPRRQALHRTLCEAQRGDRRHPEQGHGQPCHLWRPADDSADWGSIIWRAGW